MKVGVVGLGFRLGYLGRVARFGGRKTSVPETDRAVDLRTAWDRFGEALLPRAA